MKNKLVIHASALERVLLCPGSAQAEAGLPDKPSPEAESGKRIHAALAELALNQKILPQPTDLPLYSALPEDEKRIAGKLSADLRSLGEQHLGFQKMMSEVCLESQKIPICGTPDLLAVCNDGWLLLVDYKTGWSEPIPAEKNLQLRAYAYLALTEQTGYGGYGKLLACLLTKQAPPQITKYGNSDLLWIEKELRIICRRARSKKAKRLPGVEQCQYCKANGNPERCPESCHVPTIVVTPPVVLGKLPAIYKQFKLAEKAHVAFLEYLRELMTQHPELVPWAKFGKPKRRRIITAAALCYKVGMNEGWFNQDNFIRDCISVSVPAIEKLAGDKWREVEGKLKEAGVLEIKLDRPPIEVVKEENKNV